MPRAMRPLLLGAILAALWSLAPLFGSPSSLWVMPLVALVAAAGTTRVRDAVGAALASLLALALLWSAYAVAADGAAPLRQAGAAVAVVAFHAPVVAALAAGAGWIAGREAARRGPEMSSRVQPDDKRG